MQPTNHDRQTTGDSTDEHVPRRVSVPEAALLLGISEDAVRSRLRRRTLRKEKTPDGTVYVILNGTAPTDRPPTDGDQPSTGEATDHADPRLLEALRDQVEMLRDQLDQERDANRENRRIIAALVGRVPELESRAPAETAPASPGQPEAATEEASRGPGPAEDSPASEGRTERRERSWWRRFFGFE